MASVTCPTCGRDNPDFLDNCQFCQTALRREATINIGEGPTKKTTGELEGVLPDWLKDARQQARDGAKEEAEKEATRPKIQKAEPLDLLAGLAFQAADNEEEVPDWLAAINPVADKKASTPSKPAEPESSDFFAQFNQPTKEEPKPAEEASAWMQDSAASSQNDELGGWMDQTSSAPAAESFDFGAGAQDDNSWLNNLGAPASPQQPAEDLGWLHDLEATSSPKPPVDAPQADMGWMPNANSSQEDLSWLNNLGGMPVNEQPASQPTSSPDDMSWLDNLGGMPTDQAPVSQPPASSQEDLSWLNNLGATPANEPPASQPSASSQEDLSWLNNLSGVPTDQAPVSQPPASSQEDLSWLNNMGGLPANEPPAPQSPGSSQEDLSWLNNLGGVPTTNEPIASQPVSDDMSWLNNLGGTPASEAPVSPPASSDNDLGWLNNLGSTPVNEPTASQPASDDMGWLNNIGDTPAAEAPASQPASDDMGWLNNLGGTPAAEAPASQPTASDDDLGWLNNLGSAPVNEPVASQPASDDMGWLSNFGATPAAEAPVSQPTASDDDLGWLNNLGTPVNEAPVSQPAETQDLGWLNNIGTPATEAPISQPVETQDLGWLNNVNSGPSSMDVGEPASSSAEEPAMPDWFANTGEQPKYSPAHTAPLSDEAVNNMPDWLRSATEAPSMPPLDAAASRNWFAQQAQPAEESKFDSDQNQVQSAGFQSFEQDQASSFDKKLGASDSLIQGTPESAPQNFFPAEVDSAPISNQDIDSLFAVDMPDWLTQGESASAENQPSSTQGGIPSAVDDSLSPVNLPSWVQAMRPVEAAIGSTPIPVADQPTEREGPLAGFNGVIPLAPIGSARRPKPISLKLQASDEQQTTAALLEQIIASETTAHPFRTPAIVATQRTLRWVLTGLFLIILGAVIGLGTTLAPVTISNNKMSEISSMAGTIQSLSENASVLVVMDYEPALAGEMEAAAGPLLDQVVIARQPKLTFVSTSPNGTALVERLLTNTKISQSAPNGGQGYQLDSQYFNVGYLSGGLTGVRGFIEQPNAAMPSVAESLFSDFAAVIIITDQAESGQTWIEQVTLAKQTNPALAAQPLLVVSSAQAGPLLQPYVSSKQVAGMISGLADASRYEFMNNSRPGIARTYWDAFGVGLFLAITCIILGSLWNIISGFRARNSQAENG